MDDIKQMYEDVRHLQKYGYWSKGKVPDWATAMKCEHDGGFCCVHEAWECIARALAAEKGW